MNTKHLAMLIETLHIASREERAELAVQAALRSGVSTDELRRAITKAERPWSCYVHTRFSSCGWDFVSYEQAIAYAKDQFNFVLIDCKRFPEYQGQLADYRAEIKGPDGTNLTIWAEYWPRD